MLGYIENYDYGGEGMSIDELAAELAAAIGRDSEVKEIYEVVRRAVIADLTYDDFAITRVVPDVLRVRERSEAKALLLLCLLADPYASYSELGERVGWTKQRVGFVLKELSGEFRWLQDFLAIHNGRR